MSEAISHGLRPLSALSERPWAPHSAVSAALTDAAPRTATRARVFKLNIAVVLLPMKANARITDGKVIKGARDPVPIPLMLPSRKPALAFACRPTTFRQRGQVPRSLPSDLSHDAQRGPSRPA